MINTRWEQDSMGKMSVPADALWGAQTQRAVENFPVSGYRFGRHFVRALGRIKAAAADVNRELGLLDGRLADAIMSSATEVISGDHDGHFVIDIFQTGSGTSTNMNANEVIASLANERLGGVRGGKSPVHPNDHVNLGQSSNDVIPTALHLAVHDAAVDLLLPALTAMEDVLQEKAAEFHNVLKIGRTHLQDATPVRLGQVVAGWEAMIREARIRLEQNLAGLAELAIGGTAVGTGINTHPEFGPRMAERLTALTGTSWKEAADHFAAQGGKDAVVAVSGALRGLAVSVSKIAEDVRWLASGPRCAIGELKIPAVQPGSSIMPGKVNPVLPESLLQVAAFVIGQDATVTIAGMSGRFELNVMMPLLAHSLLESIRLLGNGIRLFTDRCLAGLEADRERCSSLLESSLALCTPLALKIGYDRAADIAKRAYREGRTIREIALEENLLPAEELDKILDPSSMV